MAVMELRNASTGALLCGEIENWERWDRADRIPTKTTIAGAIVVMAGQRARQRTCRINCLFDAATPGSTLANFDEIIRLQHLNRLFSFRDREGVTTTVRILDWESGIWSEVRTKSVQLVTFTLLDPRVIY
jgi:hypothetical protein